MIVSSLFNTDLICVTPEEAAVSTELQLNEASTGKAILYGYNTYTEIINHSCQILCNGLPHCS